MQETENHNAAVIMDHASARIIQNACFTLPQKSMTALVGPSGSGKTTLMRMIVGTQANVRGKVQVLGQPAGHPDLRSRVTYATQAASVFEDLTVQENLDYVRSIYRLPKSRIDQILERLELSRQAKTICAKLSGGQRSRVSLAMALLSQPELIVLDEPTVGLDPLLRWRLWQLFHELVAEGAALIVSSHILDEADQCEHVLFVDEGRVEYATRDEVLATTGTDSMEDAFVAVMGR